MMGWTVKFGVVGGSMSVESFDTKQKAKNAMQRHLLEGERMAAKYNPEQRTSYQLALSELKRLDLDRIPKISPWTRHLDRDGVIYAHVIERH